MNFQKTGAALAIRVFGLLLAIGIVASPAMAQTAGGAGALNNALNSGTGLNSNNGSAVNTEINFYYRNPNAQQYGPTELGGADVIKDQHSMGPGIVTIGPQNSGPVYVWPISVPTSMSTLPTLRDTAITKNMLKTFGYPVSDTQYQAIRRYDDNIMLEQFSDPQRWMWLMTTMAGLQSTSAANSTANMANNQAQSAIGFCKSYLTNFTAEQGNQWQAIRDQLFIPMAILLLLPGAVIAQVRAIVAQGSPILGEVTPFEGIIRSIIAIFLIPGTFLVINYGIDVANSITFTIADEYQRIFNSDMYEDAICGQMRAFASNGAQSNDNAILPGQAQPNNMGTAGPTVWNQFEADVLTTRKVDPCAGLDQQVITDEKAPWNKQVGRFMTNGANAMLTQTWNVMCAFQMAFLYYLWCMGPIAAALWVWPVGKMRAALPSWVEGVIILCFWSLFWNTVILLMACFRGVGDSGTIIFSALNTLATYCVQYAFDFAGLVSEGASQGVQEALKGMMQGAQHAASGGKGGSPGGHSPGRSSGASSGARGAGRGASGSPGMSGAMRQAGAENARSALMGGPGPSGSHGVGATGLHPAQGTGGALGVPAGAGTIAALSGSGSPSYGSRGLGDLQGGPLGSHGGQGNIVPAAFMPPPPAAGGSFGGPPGGPGAIGANALGSAHGAGPNATHNASTALADGQAAANSAGLGLRMDSTGHLQMNSEAMQKLQQSMGGTDPQQALSGAMWQAQQGDYSKLNSFMQQANSAGVLDQSTINALGSMANNGVVPFVGQDGALALSGRDALSLGQNYNMPMTGIPSSSTVGDAGPLQNGFPNPTQTSGLDPNGTLQNGVNGNLPPSDPNATMQGLQNLSNQEKQGNMQLFDATTGQAITGNDLSKAIANGDTLQALGANGQALAQYDPNTGSWSAAGTNGGVTMGSDGNWYAGSSVGVTADASGNFSAAGTNYSYNSATGTFDVNGSVLPASSVSGELLRAEYAGAPAADATISALARPDVAQNLTAALNGDSQAMARVEQGLQGTGVNAETLGMAARGNALAEASVLGQEARVNSSIATDAAGRLGISESTVSNAAFNPISAAEVAGAQALATPELARDMTRGMQNEAQAQQLLSQASTNSVAAAQFVGLESGADMRYGNYATQALQMPNGELTKEMGSNPVLAAQAVGAQAMSDKAFAGDVARSMNVSQETVMAAATSPTIAAQMVAGLAAADPGYAAQVQQSVPGLNPGVLAEAQNSPLAAMQLAAAEAAYSPNYAREIAGPAMNIATPEQFQMIAQSPVAAAQALSSELQSNDSYMRYASQTMGVSENTMREAAYSPLQAAAVAAAEMQRNPGYGEIAGRAMNCADQQLLSAAPNSPLAAAQMLAREASSYDGGVQQLASHFHVAPELVQQAAYNPVAAAQLVAADAMGNANHRAELISQTGMSGEQIAQAVSNPTAAAQLMASEVSRGDPGYMQQVASSMHVGVDQLREAAVRSDVAGVIANASYGMASSSVDGPAQLTGGMFNYSQDRAASGSITYGGDTTYGSSSFTAQGPVTYGDTSVGAPSSTGQGQVVTYGDTAIGAPSSAAQAPVTYRDTVLGAPTGSPSGPISYGDTNIGAPNYNAVQREAAAEQRQTFNQELAREAGTARNAYSEFVQPANYVAPAGGSQIISSDISQPGATARNEYGQSIAPTGGATTPYLTSDITQTGGPVLQRNEYGQPTGQGVAPAGAPTPYISSDIVQPGGQVVQRNEFGQPSGQGAPIPGQSTPYISADFVQPGAPAPGQATPYISADYIQPAAPAPQYPVEYGQPTGQTVAPQYTADYGQPTGQTAAPQYYAQGDVAQPPSGAVQPYFANPDPTTGPVYTRDVSGDAPLVIPANYTGDVPQRVPSPYETGPSNFVQEQRPAPTQDYIAPVQSAPQGEARVFNADYTDRTSEVAQGYNVAADGPGTTGLPLSEQRPPQIAHQDAPQTIQPQHDYGQGSGAIIPAIVSPQRQGARPPVPPQAHPAPAPAGETDIAQTDAGPTSADNPMGFNKAGRFKGYSKQQQREDLRKAGKNAPWLPEDEDEEEPKNC